MTWQRQELGTAAQRLADAADIPLWLDRRVDRQVRISIQIADLTLDQALERIAQEKSLGYTKFGNLVYLGPRQTAVQINALSRQAHADLSEFPARVRKLWLQPKPTAWPRLSEPKQLVESWLQSVDVQLVGAERIPHDLWAEQSLPPLALIDRLTLVLAGFDLACQTSPDGASCQIVDIPQTEHREQQDPYAAEQGAARQKTRRRYRDSNQRFTLRIENQPLGRVLDQFAQQLGLELLWPTGLEDRSRDQLISCDVQQVDLDELLRRVLSPANLQHRRRVHRVTIEPRP